MARELLAGTFKDGSDILVDVVNDRLTLTHDDAKSSSRPAALAGASVSDSTAGPFSSSEPA